MALRGVDRPGPARRCEAGKGQAVRGEAGIGKARLMDLLVSITGRGLARPGGAARGGAMPGTA
jgi:hypothetical protein